MADTAPYFELNLMYRDGRQVEPAKYATVQEAMAQAEAFPGVFGAILLVAAGADPVRVIEYNADGTVDVGDDVPADDQDEPWTPAEIAANKAEAAQYRASRGI